MRVQTVVLSRMIFSALLAVTLLASGCATVPLTQRTQVKLVPTQELVASSFQSYDSIIKESQLSTDKSSIAMLNTVGKRLSAATEDLLREIGRENELQYYDWEYNLIKEDSTVNAFCMPGGKIVVYTGILPIARSETGLAVIVGHEIAHAIANHGNERVSQMLITELGAQTLSRAVASNPAQTQQIIMMAYGVGSQLGYILPYSRLHEKEADRIGLILMAKAGYDPREAISFWERMAQAGGANVPEFVSTHPASTTRIDLMKENLPEAMTYYKK
ncbi:MAG: M48 family metallopeptidase [Candidatus Auribacterota bacterium]